MAVENIGHLYLSSIIISFIFSLVILVMGVVVSYQYDYAKDDIEKNNEIVDSLFKFLEPVDTEDSTILNRNLYSYTVGDEPLREYLHEDVNSIKRLNKAGFYCALIDFGLRCAEIFLFCIGRKQYGPKCILITFIFISYAFIISYLGLFSKALQKTKKIKSFIGDLEDAIVAKIDGATLYNYNDYPFFGDFKDDIKNTKNILTAMIIIICFIFAFQLITTIVFYVCIGLDKNKDYAPKIANTESNREINPENNEMNEIKQNQEN